MDSPQIDKLQVKPGEINRNTGRILIGEKRLPLQAEITTKQLRAYVRPEVDHVTRFEFTDLHRIWVPFIYLLAFVLFGIFLFHGYQMHSALEKEFRAQKEEIFQIQKENVLELNRIKSELDQQKKAIVALEEMSLSVKELKANLQGIQKKIDSLNMKEVLMIEPASSPASSSPTSTTPPAPTNPEKVP